MKTAKLTGKSKYEQQFYSTKLSLRIGKTNGIFARAPRSQAPCSAPGVGHTPQDGVVVGLIGVPQGEDLGTGGFGKLGGSKSHYNNLPGIETQGV